MAWATGTDERSAAEATLRVVEVSPRKAVVDELAAKAHAALDRGAKLRQSGDEGHAKLADGLALTWAEAARDVLRAVDTEDRAAAVRQNAADAGAAAERERALLEEGIGQTGRLKAQLATVTKETTAPRTSSIGKDAPDGGTPSPSSKNVAPGKDGGT